MAECQEEAKGGMGVKTLETVVGIEGYLASRRGAENRRGERLPSVPSLQLVTPRSARISSSNLYAVFMQYSSSILRFHHSTIPFSFYQQD